MDKIDMGGDQFSFPITVAPSDAAGNDHVGYHKHLQYFKSARDAYLGQFGFSDLNMDGCICFVVEAHCKYKRELLLGDRVMVKCRMGRLDAKSFEMAYRIEREGDLCATGNTVSVCIDPENRKAAAWPRSFVSAIHAYEGNVEGLHAIPQDR
jgi:acyl-CoA thioester hydrolase